MSDWRSGRRLDLAWYARPSEDVARSLLGTILIVRDDDGVTTAGRIVETEAYLGDGDAASHANLYKRGRAALMRRPGHVYMYRAYGMHAMFNIVTESEGVAGAVLVRAIEPVAGIPVMIERRGVDRLLMLGRGPGNLCVALGLKLDDDGRDLTNDERVWIAEGNRSSEIAVSTRIGITRNPDALLRFFDPSSRAVSNSRRAMLMESATGRSTIE